MVAGVVTTSEKSKPENLEVLLSSFILYFLFSFLISKGMSIFVQLAAGLLLVATVSYATLALGKKVMTFSLALFLAFVAASLLSWEFGILLGLAGIQFIFIFLPMHAERKWLSIFAEYGVQIPETAPVFFKLALRCILLLGVLAISYVLLILLLNQFGLNDLANITAVLGRIPLYLILVPALTTAFAEEIFFRGFLLRRFGILASSVLFMFSHVAYGSLTELAVAFLAGLIFCAYVKRTRDLTAPIIVHFAVNAASIAVNYGLIGL
ncbi:hypothetical protein COS70_02315 [Candidatus Micrarchaeota archaeon CG06_land_8_20_14_3_00_50_6]|nr:MAG: hypothetical protein COS70_02315 [Candidatus Micrarchaeota archaeon CG06_land_8_20_14_3_00_50_6]